MRILKNAFALCLVFLISGCAVVYAPSPVGEKTVTLKPADWEGTWFHEDGVMVAKVKDSEKGILQVAGVEEKDNQLKLNSFDAYIRESGEWMFLSMKDEDNPERYLWGRIKKGDRQVFVWAPDAEKFKSLVSSGKLPGKVDGDNVILGELKPEHLQLITSGSEGLLFRWEDPLAFIRLAK